MHWFAFSVFANVVACSTSSFSSGEDARKRIASDEFLLVSFVEPQLASNKAFLEEWKNVGTELTSTLTIDCSQETEICNDLDVLSFPAIRLYQKGSMSRYRGPRTSKDMLSYAQRMKNPIVSQLKPALVKEFSESDDLVVLAVVSADDKSFRKRFEDLATTYHDRYSFGLVDGDLSSVSCHNNMDSTQHQAQDLEQVGSLKRLLEVCKEPLIPQLTRRNEIKYMSGSKSLVYYFHHDETDREQYVNDMRETARTYHEFLTLVTVDADEYPHMPTSLGLVGKGGLAVQNLHNGEVFPYEEKEITAGGVANFIFAISEGQVSPWDGVVKAPHVRDEL
ncbi:hypothetical protein VHEMI00122 [[Torrubiella] hemipterigena]|uniref:Uncharacterized protein n=1 Tax=[Torrubiella] hemipterigena TaxID=1531966 RepID=A0A0A1T3H9_9HYPO|nr:hypothetical protein VHEMI00122 [[Torrubiella] hemipterigena]